MQYGLLTALSGCFPFFEKAYPKDDIPVKSIKKCREWSRTGIFRMADIRKASLDSHAAARKAKRITLLVLQPGQAVATAHVSRHAFGSAYYALKAVSAANPLNPNAKIKKSLLGRQSICPKA